MRKQNQRSYSAYFAYAAFTVLALAAMTYAAQTDLGSAADKAEAVTDEFLAHVEDVGSRCVQALMSTSDFFSSKLQAGGAFDALIKAHPAEYEALRAPNESALTRCLLKGTQGTLNAALSSLGTFAAKANVALADLCNDHGICFTR